MTITNASRSHYKRMMTWVLTQPLNDTPNCSLMNDAIGEDWSGTYCPYCNYYYDCTDGCELYAGSGCCNDLWEKMSSSETWKDWLIYADKVDKYIEKHG